jgi:putative glycosyltransferase (TIGR04372 family)
MRFSFKNNKYFVLSPFEYAIGNAAEFIFFGSLIANKYGYKLVIIKRSKSWLRVIFKKLDLKPITNSEIFNLDCNNPCIIKPSKVIEINLDFIYLIVYFLNKSIFRFYNKFASIFSFKSFLLSYIPTLGHDLIFNPLSKKEYTFENVLEIGWTDIFKIKLDFLLDKEKEILANQILLKFGLEVNSWFVCLHVRELGFHNDSKDGLYRCANINNYINAIKFIVDKGGYVIRLGDSSMTKLPEISGVVDYPFTKYKSDFMDLYLIKNCKYYIGMDSGIYDVALLFQKPIIMVNNTSWNFAIPLNKCDLMILKHFFSKKLNRFLSIKEMLMEPFSIIYHFTEIPSESDSEYIIVENSSFEIFNLIKEKLEMVDENFEYSNLQFEFCKLRRIQILEFMKSDFFKTDLFQSYRVAARYFFMGTIGDKYLYDNWEYGTYLQNLTREYLVGND